MKRAEIHSLNQRRSIVNKVVNRKKWPYMSLFPVIVHVNKLGIKLNSDGTFINK